ncbi:MAG: CRISPR-associated protein Csx14 [Archaeoglobaceae archaeon]
MKTAIISPLGLSPPVITTFVEGIGENISDLVVLTTENEDVKAGYELVRIGLRQKYPKTRLHEVTLPFEDVNTTEENLRFMSICAKIIREERERYKCDKILLNVAGGRKNMCITLSLLGQLMAVDGVYHVVSRDVKIVN